MHISNFRPVKRVRDIVATFARVNQHVPSVLIMVGDGPERVEAEAEARDLGVSEHVHFLGKIDTIAPLLAGADLFLMMSDKESFGLSALEAMASGVPVIGARAGGLPEVVTDGVTGYLRDVGDVEGMARAAVQLLQDPRGWSAMSEAAAADARKRYAEDAIVAQYESLYRRTLVAPSRPTPTRASLAFDPSMPSL
jgi:N-acetyl-alpha-D-glucosaminyl L-malate synthase BshA